MLATYFSKTVVHREFIQRLIKGFSTPGLGDFRNIKT